jgi:hypothetical protein
VFSFAMTVAAKYEWLGWAKDPIAEKHGVSFDRTPAGVIRAPAGQFRVCAYHIDFDERPTCYTDVATIEEAAELCARLGEHCTWNVDFASAFDDQGNCVEQRFTKA